MDDIIMNAENIRNITQMTIIGLPDTPKIEANIMSAAERGESSICVTVKGVGLADKICWHFRKRDFSITKLATNNSGEESEVDIIISW